MLRSTCLHACFYAYMSRPMFSYACMLLAMFMCIGLGFVCHAMCYYSPFVPFIAFSCVLAYWFRPDIDPMVFVIVHTPRPTSKSLDHPICMFMLACLLLCFMLVLASLVLGIAMLDALHRLDLVWLHPMPMRPCLGVTTWDASDAGLLHTYPSLFCSVR